MEHNNRIEAARNHLAAYPNSFFTFQRGAKAPYGSAKADILIAEVKGILHPLAMAELPQDQSNLIDQMMTDHNTLVYERRQATGNVVNDVPTPTATVAEPLEEEEDDNNLDDEDEDNDEMYDEDDGEYADHERWQEDLTQHQVPGQLAEQARRTQAINDETIAAKMTEYSQVQGGYYSWNDAMINLALEAAMIATLANPAALIGADDRSRIVPGRRGPTDVAIVDTTGVAHALVFVDHRLRVTDTDALDQNGHDLLDKANALLLGNLKRQVLEIAEALRFLEPEKKNWLATLGGIVKNVLPQNDEHTMRANGSRVTATVTNKTAYHGVSRIELEGTIDNTPYTASIHIETGNYTVSVFGVYGEDHETVKAALEAAQPHYSQIATQVTNDERATVRERCNEDIPAAQALVKRLGDEIRDMERALAVA